MSESEVNTPLLYQAISQTLGIEIIDGTWAVNTARTLESIQERFSVSRTVAREAARQLEAMGLVSARRRHGIVAQPIDRWMVLD
ncbi:MAG TPA: GntR family transcriptional regulator, partial [Pseudoclavibacter sp.]|nr:GntR family transcriptional regulator [Pseudoclavibacter sp.]